MLCKPPRPFYVLYTQSVRLELDEVGELTLGERELGVEVSSQVGDLADNFEHLGVELLLIGDPVGIDGLLL